MANYSNLTEIADRLNLSKSTVVNRFKKLGIEPMDLNHKLWYLKSDIEMLKTMKNTRNFIKPSERFAIIEYFLSTRNNSVTDLQNVFFIPQQRIDRIITDFLNNGMCITVPSKMNRI